MAITLSRAVEFQVPLHTFKIISISLVNIYSYSNIRFVWLVKIMTVLRSSLLAFLLIVLTGAASIADETMNFEEYPGYEHAQSLFDGEHSQDLIDTLLMFLELESN